jgi:hypothetical protein
MLITYRGGKKSTEVSFLSHSTGEQFETLRLQTTEQETPQNFQKDSVVQKGLNKNWGSMSMKLDSRHLAGNAKDICEKKDTFAESPN